MASAAMPLASSSMTLDEKADAAIEGFRLSNQNAQRLLEMSKNPAVPPPERAEMASVATELMRSADENANAVRSLHARIQVRRHMTLDILFILDVTVSMKKQGDAIRGQLLHILESLKGLYQDMQVCRIGIVGYRDLRLNPRFEILRLTPLTPDSTDGIEEWIHNIEFKTSTVNDFPEDVHGALEKACSDAEVGWSGSPTSTRTVIHIADAPGHGPKMVDRSLAADDSLYRHVRDHYPDLDPDSVQLRAMMLKLREELKVLKYFFMHVETTIDSESRPPRTEVFTRQMVTEFQRACGDPAWVQELEWVGPEEFAFQVIAAVSTSIRSSISLRHFSGADVHRFSGELLEVHQREEVKFILDSADPDWNTLPALAVKIFRHDQIHSINKLNVLIAAKEPKHLSCSEVRDSSPHSKKPALLRIAPSPFTNGNNRLVYYGRYYPKGLGNPDGDEYEEVVLKEFLHKVVDPKAEEMEYKAQMESQSIAYYLADCFNEHARTAIPELKVPPIEYVMAELVEVRRNPQGRIQYFLMEPLVIGEFERWNDNVGYFKEADPQPHLQAFSHWTHVVTRGQLMVVDIQGFRTMQNDESGECCMRIVLTDPALHCIKQGFYGGTNLPCGPERFFFSHNNKTGKQHGVHGPICEALCTEAACKSFRDQQLQRARAEPGNNAQDWRVGRRARGRGYMRQNAPGVRTTPRFSTSGHSRACSPEREAASVRSDETSASVKRRTVVTKLALKAHEMCARKLKAAGKPIPGKLFAAIEECKAGGYITDDEAQRMHEVRLLRNAAQHEEFSCA